MPTLHIHLLGDFLLLSDDTTVTTVTIPRVQSLLAYLVLHRTAPQSRSHLAFLLWPDSTEAQAHTNLRQLLYHLRQSLPDVNQFLSTSKQSLQWLPTHTKAAWTLDILEFEQALAQAEQAHDPAALRSALVRAIHLYRGDLLPGCYEEWIFPERDRLRLSFLQTAERLIVLLEAERDYATAITTAHQLLRHDAMHEATYRQLMRLYALRGDRAAALRIYHTCVTVLERELGAEPSEDTQTLYKSLVQARSAAETLTTHSTVRGAETPLLGRKAEWRTLQEAWRKVAGGHPHIVILSGEAGIGKTRLAEEMEAWVSRQGMATASTRCYAAPGQLAYAPVTSWLRSDALQAGLSTLDAIFLTEIARLIPEIVMTRPKLPRPATMAEGWQRQQFFEALARAVISAHQPLLLLIDDLQWCDSDTLAWLHSLLRFDPKACLLLIGTVRTEETLPGHPLLAFLSALQRDSLVTEVPLGPLMEAEMASLAEHITGHPLDPVRSSTLYAETEGNPLFVVEMARAGMVEQHKNVAWQGARSLLTQSGSPLPSVVQSVLAARLAQISPLARDVANVASVIGREFSFSVLARVSSEREDVVVQGLDELWQRRIVREQGTGTADTYDFSHGKLREHVYASLSLAYRRLLHRRVAEALKAEAEEEWASVSGQIAVHYERAGLLEQAIPAYQQAGEVARRFYANAEAKNAFERAAALLEAASPGQNLSWETRVQIYEAIGEVSMEMGSYQEAIQVYQRAMTCVPGQVHLLQAHLQWKIANAWNQATTNNPFDVIHSNARLAFQEAERILLLIEDPASPQWRQEWIQLQFARIWPFRGSIDDVTVAIEKAQPIIEQYGTQEQRGFFFFVVATRNLIRDRFVISEQTLVTWRATLAAVLQKGDEYQIGGVRFGFGVALLWSGHLDEAEEQLREALNVGERTDRAWLRARSLTFLPFVFRLRGQRELVRDMLMRAQTIGALQNNGILLGHRAWIAWRDGDLVEAETYGRMSLDEKNLQRMELMNTFQWVGLWPLLGVALTREKIEEAISHVRTLLDPTQQPPPEALSKPLETVLRAWDAGEQEEAHALLQRAVPLARDMGYL